MTSPKRPLSPATRAVRASIASDASHGAVVPPIHLSATFAFEGFNKPRTYDYTRSGNPTRSQLGDAIAQLEGGHTGVITSTGMSAVTLVLQLLNPQDTIVAAHDCYGGTQRLLRGLSGRGHFGVRFLDLTSPASLAAIAEVRPRIVWIETPSNPLLRITDVQAVADAAHAAGALVVVDNTFLSPALQQPLALGADVVVHSTTKYLNGHSDVVGGAVVTAESALGEELGWWANCLGITGAPFDSYLTLRGIRTLHSRIRDHLEGAAAVVEALRSHPAVARVYYPGLEDHPGHDIARRQQKGFGAMVSFEIEGGTRGVEHFVSQLRCFTLAESLGGVESLVAHPATMTHSSMTPEARATAGISESLLRLSVGIESPEDLVADLKAALDDVEVQIPRRSAPRDDKGVVIPSEARNLHVSDVVLVGVGSIGRELIAQIGEQHNAQNGLRIVGLVDRSGFVFNENGLPRERLAELRELKSAGQPLAESIDGRRGSAQEALETFAAHSLSNPILVDATAAEISDVLCGALSKGFDLVLANKLPLATNQTAVDRLRETARVTGRAVLCEATVGAGLPVLDTLRKLQEAGDDVLSIEGCPSGTLGFLFGEMSRGEPFSEALRRAIELGYTEPDPRIDLSGIDVARKALILARAIGYRGELEDVRVESLVPDAWGELTREQFLARVTELDGSWAMRVNELRRKGKVLRYRAHVTPERITVGLTVVKLSDPLATLTGTDNQFTFTTKRYRTRPLVITGPGAGAAVTAAGVFNDLLWLARGRGERSERASRPAETRRYSPPRRAPRESPTR
jgi:cystathionine gamma-synthase